MFNVVEQPMYSPQTDVPFKQQLGAADLSDLRVPLFDRSRPSLADLSGSGLLQVSAPASQPCYSGRSGTFGTSKEVMTREQQEYVYLIPADGTGGIHFTNDDTYYSINDFLSAFNTNPSSPLCKATLEEKSEKKKGSIATNYWRVVCKKPITQEMFNKVGNEYERGGFYLPEKGLKEFLACQDTSVGEGLPSENPVIENPQPDPDTQPTKTPVHAPQPSDQSNSADFSPDGVYGIGDVLKEIWPFCFAPPIFGGGFLYALNKHLTKKYAAEAAKSQPGEKKMTPRSSRIRPGRATTFSGVAEVLDADQAKAEFQGKGEEGEKAAKWNNSSNFWSIFNKNKANKNVQDAETYQKYIS